MVEHVGQNRRPVAATVGVVRAREVAAEHLDADVGTRRDLQHLIQRAVWIACLDAEVVVAPAVVVAVAQLLDAVRYVGLIVHRLADHQVREHRPVLDLASRQHRDAPCTFAQADRHRLESWHPRP